MAKGPMNDCCVREKGGKMPMPMPARINYLSTESDGKSCVCLCSNRNSAEQKRQNATSTPSSPNQRGIDADLNAIIRHCCFCLAIQDGRG